MSKSAVRPRSRGRSKRGQCDQSIRGVVPLLIVCSGHAVGLERRGGGHDRQCAVRVCRVREARGARSPMQPLSDRPRGTGTPPPRPGIHPGWLPPSRTQQPLWLRLRELRDEEAVDSILTRLAFPRLERGRRSVVARDRFAGSCAEAVAGTAPEAGWQMRVVDHAVSWGPWQGDWRSADLPKRPELGARSMPSDARDV